MTECMIGSLGIVWRLDLMLAVFNVNLGHSDLDSQDVHCHVGESDIDCIIQLNRVIPNRGTMLHVPWCMFNASRVMLHAS